MRKPGPPRDIPPPLEMLCLKALWSLGEGNVSDVRTVVTESKPLAYTTIMTTLDRLHKKGILDRDFDTPTRAFRYRPKQTRGEFYRATLAADPSPWGRLSTGRGEADKLATCPTLPIRFSSSSTSSRPSPWMNCMT